MVGDVGRWSDPRIASVVCDMLCYDETTPIMQGRKGPTVRPEEGVRQGRVKSMAIFASTTAARFQPVVRHWLRRKLAFELPGDAQHVHIHSSILIYTDDIFLFSKIPRWVECHDFCFHGGYAES